MVGAKDPLVARNNDFIEGALVTFIVGRDLKRCSVHKSLLQRQAANFSKLETPADGEYDFTAVDANIFELYVHHLYTGEIQCKMPRQNSKSDVDDQSNALIKLYFLARTLGDDYTKHAVLRAFLEDAKRSQKQGKTSAPGNSAVKKFWEGYKFEPEEPLCRLFIDLYIWDATIEETLCLTLCDEVDEFFANVVMNTACQKLLKGDTQGISNKTCCDYHQLNDGEKCGSKKRKRNDTQN